MTINRSENSDDKGEIIDLDYVLINELGQFGRFQFKYICLIALPMMAAGFYGDYVFTASALPHRCRIPECGESNKSVAFHPEWIAEVVPVLEGSTVSACERFAPVAGYNNTLLTCPTELFDRSRTQKCDEFVYEGTNSVVYDVGIRGRLCGFLLCNRRQRVTLSEELTVAHGHWRSQEAYK